LKKLHLVSFICIMNRNFTRQGCQIFDYSGELSDTMEFPGRIDSEFTIPPLKHVDDYSVATKLMNSYDELSYSGLYDDDVNNLYDYRDSPMEEYSIQEIALMDRLLYQDRELDRIGQFEHLGYAENLAYLEHWIRKQQWSSKWLREDEDQWGSTRMDLWQSACDDFTTLYEDEDSLGQLSSMDLYSDQGSSSKCTSQSDINKADLVEVPQQKSRHCRHFLKGRCERGKACGFRHDISVFCTDMQKVFLGGLPTHMTSSLLRQRLSEYGYSVLNNPKIHRWFTPQVCLGSIAEAKRLVEQGTIMIDGAIVRVRPFQAFSQDNKKKLPDEVERSVFLGGLLPGTTAEIIKNDLGSLGLVAVNIPVVKPGYCPQVALQTIQQARRLLRLARVKVNGVMVNVRPFANIRSSSWKKKNKRIRLPNQSK